MKYNYQFRTIDFGQFGKDLIIDLPKEIELVSTFLGSDVQSDGRWFLDVIDKVLSGQEEYQEFGGNVCVLQIFRNKTKVLDSLADDGIGSCCEIETNELKELIILWLTEQKKFKQQIQD